VADVRHEVTPDRLDPFRARAVVGQDDHETRRERGDAGVHVGDAAAARLQLDLRLAHLAVPAHLVHEGHELVGEPLVADEAHRHGRSGRLHDRVGGVDDDGRGRQHREHRLGPGRDGVHDLGDLRLAPLAVAPQPRDDRAHGGADHSGDQQSCTGVHTSIVGLRSARVVIREWVDVRLSGSVHAAFTAGRHPFTEPL
jgi:hypothetical protein